MINNILNCILFVFCFVSCNYNNNPNSKDATINKFEESIAKNEITEPASFVEKLKNRKPIEVNENLIYGEWEDQNSLVTYDEDYKFFGSFDKYKLKQQELGTFELKGDTLQMHFTSTNHHPAYIITEMTENEFTIESVDDGAIFYKKRVK